MKRATIVIIITVMLISLSVYELLTVNKLVTYLQDSVNDVYPQYFENKDDITILSDKIIKLDNYWESYEDGLFLIYSHKDLSPISDSIKKLIAYTNNNDYDNAIAEVEMLKNLAENCSRIVGFSFQNVL